jgi:hypothetical protein
MVRLAPAGHQRREPAGTERVVGRDLLRLDSGEGEDEHGDLAGAVAADPAVEEHAARLGAGDRGDHARAVAWEPLEMRAVVQGSAELRAPQPVRPELGVLDAVERQMDRRQPRGARLEVVRELVVVAQVDDRAHAVRLERRPAGGGQVVERVGTDDRAMTCRATVGGAQPAEGRGR